MSFRNFGENVEELCKIYAYWLQSFLLLLPTHPPQTTNDIVPKNSLNWISVVAVDPFDTQWGNWSFHWI